MSQEIPSTQKAVVVTAKGKVEMKEVPVVQPAKHQVLVRIVKTGVCHTDLHACEGDWPIATKDKLIAGHEGAGIVVALGPHVKNVKVGDRVGIVWLHDACGLCEYCLKGQETVCPNQKNSGYSVDGSFQEYAIASASHVAKLPDNLSFEEVAPILCAGLTTYKGLKETEVKPGEIVLIVGAGGGLGHLAVQYAKAMGMKVIGVDSGEDKKKLLVDKLKIDYFVDFATCNPVEEVSKITKGRGVDGVLIVAASGKAFDQAIKYVRRRGTIVCIGLPPGNMSFPIFDVVLQGLTIRGSIVGTRQDLTEALNFAADGKVHTSYDVLKLEQVGEVFERMKAGKIAGRIVLDVAGHLDEKAPKHAHAH